MAYLNWIGFELLHFESVNQPQSEIDNQQKGNRLAARFVAILLGAADAASGHVRNEKQLHRHLHSIIETQ